VLVPNILPGFVSGALFAFIASFDNYPVSMFLVDVRTKTLPIQLLNYLEISPDPTLAAVSTGLIGLTVLVLTSALDWQDANGGWTADATLARGLPVAGGDLGFTALRLNAARLQRLDDRHQLLLRGALQASPTAALPSSEQFLLGGVATVRGYSEGLLSGQRGALLSAELRHTLALTCDLPCSAQLSGFVDAGRVRAAGAPGPQQLSAAGVGLAADRGAAGLRASLAWPLRDATDEPARRRPRLHLAASLAW
jgi:hemolysin activation/secretion protein